MSKIIKNDDIIKSMVEAPSECLLIKVDFETGKIVYTIQIGKL